MFTIMACVRTDRRKRLTRQHPRFVTECCKSADGNMLVSTRTHSGNARPAKSGQRKYQGKPGPFVLAFAACMVTNSKEKP